MMMETILLNKLKMIKKSQKKEEQKVNWMNLNLYKNNYNEEYQQILTGNTFLQIQRILMKILMVFKPLKTTKLQVLE